MKLPSLRSLFILTACLGFSLALIGKTEPLNILFITVDDMSCDSIGVFGCPVPDTSPNIDKLAAQGIRFSHAHVQVGNCMPSRNVMQSGRYPHNNGVEGFYQVKNPKFRILPEILRENGYFIGIKGKVSHSTPYHPWDWDVVLTPEVKGTERSADSFYNLTRKGIQLAKDAGKPFYLVMNITDPHKPFYGMDGKQNVIEDPIKPTRIFTAEEMVVPGFLPDTPVVRKELSHYYSSVRRADDCAGAVIKALQDSGQAENTLLMFLSDHGMPLPFAKTTVWHHGTNTPWIVRWPGVVEPGKVDDHHMISAVDFAPTILDALGIDDEGMDGRSFVPVLKKGKQKGRDYVVKEYNENSGANRSPMRSVATREYTYIYNPWSDGKRIFRTATTGTLAYKEMRRIAAGDPAMAERLRVFNHRDPEELYHTAKDPDSLVNLVDNPEHGEALEKLRKTMRNWMEDTGDPLLEAFESRDDQRVASAYVDRVQRESDERRAKKNKNKPPTPKQRKDLLKVQLPKSIKAGKATVLQVRHTIPADMGEQLVHVTLKGGDGNRIERKVLKAKGTGTLKVSFDIPGFVSGSKVQFAVFIGKEYGQHYQHMASKKLPVK